MTDKADRFLVTDILLLLIPAMDIAWAFSEGFRLAANFGIISVIALELGELKVGDNGAIIRFIACMLLIVPMGTTIGCNTEYHYRWMV
jgi:predicted outer membrane lipoprotein